MNYHIELTARAFTVLESLPETISFDVFRRLDRLSQFPEMGSSLGARFPNLNGLRQLVYKRWLRVIYEFDEADQTIYILAIQDCRQKLPSPRKLKRDDDPGEPE